MLRGCSYFKRTRKRFDGFERVGNIVGSSVSAAVPILLGIGNDWILLKLVQMLRRILSEEVDRIRRDPIVSKLREEEFW